MKRDEAENAKAEVFRRAFGFEEQAAAFSEQTDGPTFLPSEDSAVGERIAAGRRTGVPDAADLIAVGFSKASEDHRRLKLALVLQNHRLRHHPIVERAREIVGAAESEIIVTGRPTLLGALNAGFCRPLLLGSSVSHVNVSAGSLGFFATCRAGGSRGIVSNNHVIAASNVGTPGDIILQPGSADGGGPVATHVARLNRFHPIDFSPHATNYVDCAFGDLIDVVDYDPNHIHDPRRLVPAVRIGEPLDRVLAGVPVVKTGRTTGRTEGSVLIASVDNLTIGWRNRGLARFDQQIAIRGLNGSFSAHGDSGSLIATLEGRPVGLLFSGTPHGIAYASPIRSVLDSLNVDLHTRP